MALNPHERGAVIIANLQVRQMNTQTIKENQRKTKAQHHVTKNRSMSSK